MIMRHRLQHPLHLGVFLLILSATPVEAQEQEAQTAPPQSQDSMTLMFEREIFFYPQGERRNPFAPLLSGEDGPRFEGIQLLGVIYSPRPGESLALFGPRAGLEEEGATGQTYRVRQGDRMGNMRILQIQETRVVVEIEEFGLTEQRIMELQRPGQGGLS
jgi:hypothetical protein